LTRKKLRRLEITAGSPRYAPEAAGIWLANDAIRHAERELARQAEVAYARTVRDRHVAQAAKVGASATPGHASNRPSKGKAARQTTSP
jgi:erythromycin esterase-like protein